MTTFRYLLAALVLLACVSAGLGDANPVTQAQTDLARLAAKVPQFKVLPLPAAGQVKATINQSLTIEDLRGVPLDDNPPQLNPLAAPYDPGHTDGLPPGQAPYVAPGIAPFRLKYFNCELNYGGWHNLDMQDYAATHGFNILYPYVRTLAQRDRMPEGTKWLKWGGFVNWGTWLPEHGLAAGRYDLLVGRDVVAELIASGFLKDGNPADWDYLMIDLEHGLQSPEGLRKQDWYPQDASAEEKLAFEKRYYDGYALTYTAPVDAAKQLGYKNISLYGWQPFRKAWYGLEKLQLDPAIYWPWQSFGQQIYRNPNLEILNPDVYVFYWVPQNVAFTLTQIDLCRQVIAAEPVQKPIRPYYWTLFHGGDANYHWWSSQPVPTEEARAWTVMCFFSGCDGFDLWNWSEFSNHHIPRPLLVKRGGELVGNDLQIKDGFRAFPEAAANDFEPPADFERYDFIHVVKVDEQTGTVLFQKIDKRDYRMPAATSVIYAMPQDELIPHLRAESEPVSGVVEGLALIKPFEYLLKHGEVKVDVPSLDQFLQSLPVVRRVKLGPYHVIVTFDPKCVYEGAAGRPIVLENFDGHAGLTLTLPSDWDTHLWVFKEG